MEGTAGDVCRLVETGIADVGFIEHTAAIPDTLEISRTVADRGDLSWSAHARRTPGAAINTKRNAKRNAERNAEIPVTRVSCLAGIGGSNDDAVENSAIPEIAHRGIDSNHCEVAGAIRRLVAITRKAKRAA